MGKQLSKNIRVGLFVVLGAIFLISGLYYIGAKQNIFGKTFVLNADFANVNGLMAGNNVRFGGINIGTVESVDLINDTTIRVVMLIKEKNRPFIKQNSVATIGTDGLMGNKLINIISVNKPASIVEDNDVLPSRRQSETEELLTVLNQTNDDVAIVARNLREMTAKLNSPNNLWSILMDTVIAENVKRTVVNIHLTSDRMATISGDLSWLVGEVRSGKGTIGALITDTSMVNDLRQTVVNVKVVSDTLGYITGDLKALTQYVKSGEGAVGTILMDTTFVYNLNQSMENLRKGTEGFNDNMDALKHSILLRKYFKKQASTEE